MKISVKPGQFLKEYMIPAAVLTVFDQFTKWLAVTNLKYKANIILMKDIFELHYLENRGAAFGMFRNMQWVFILFALAMILGIILFALFGPAENQNAVVRFLFALFTAGAAGNLVDRLLRGYVVDFFYFALIDFPIFNVADIYLTVSCVLIMLYVIFCTKEGSNSK